MPFNPLAILYLCVYISVDMGQRATSIDEQIALYLDRGLHIEDRAYAKAKLLEIGYYRLGFYCFPFEETYPKLDSDRSHKVIEGTTFEDVIALYQFDAKLRSLLFEALSHIEISFRTKLIYEASNSFGDKPCWFADDACVREEYQRAFEEDVYKRIRNKQYIIQRHHRKHRHQHFAPAWKTIEYMTFGDVIRLYEAIQDSRVKRSIARYFDVSHIGEMAFYLKVVRDLRNACAHSQVLYDMRLSYRVMRGRVFTPRSRRATVLHLGNIIRVLVYLLHQSSESYCLEFKERLNELFQQTQDKPQVHRILQATTQYQAL